MPIHPLEIYLSRLHPPVGKAEFAKRVGISPSSLSRVFTGKRRHVSAEACLRIARATGGAISLEQLLEWKPRRVVRDGRDKTARAAKARALARNRRPA